MNRKTLLRFLILFACLLFVISIFSPFLSGVWHGFRITSIGGSETFWSYKESAATINFGRGIEWHIKEWWFADYWLRVEAVADPWAGPVLIFILEAQVLTVCFAVLAILKVKPYLLFLSTLLNAFTVFFMWSVGDVLSHSYIENFEAGFWISLVSTLLFISAFILSLKRLPRATQQIRLQEKEERAMLY